MHPDLESLDRELAALGERVDRTFGGLDDATLRRRPSPDQWSPSECLMHLVLTTNPYLAKLDRLYQAAPTGVAVRRFRLGFVGWIMAKSMEPPVRARFKTMPSFVPDADKPAAEVLAAFRSSQAELRKRIQAAEGLDLNRLMVSSPFNAKIRYNVYAAFRILAAHQRRHLWQADRALSSA